MVFCRAHGCVDKGMIDFGILFDPTDLSKYNYPRIQQKDTWGVLMRLNCPLAQKEYICPEDLWDKPLIISHQQKAGSKLLTVLLLLTKD